MKSDTYYLGIDVGTGSARAGIFDATGRTVATASQAIAMWKPTADHVEQSSEDIWRACGKAVRQALSLSGVKAQAIAGIGFDATCSLVALDADDRPVSVSTTGRDAQNVIVWMDHRAMPQADRINARSSTVLRYVGGAVSPEMQTPKLCWLKENLPDTWQRTARFLDLPDFLTYRATGDDTRSLCTTVCKWTYLGHRGSEGEGWDRPFFKGIGLDDLVEENFARIGQRIRPMGEPLGDGLTTQAARELGLAVGTPVAVAIIDAHAGGLGMLGARTGAKAITAAGLNRRLALIGGTSSCHMAVSPEPRFIRGVWGPYLSAMVPDFWLTEGGQSATGALIDHVIFTHGAAGKLKTAAKRAGQTPYQLLNARLDDMATAEGVSHPAELTRDLHVQPDFHGNRSPRADASLRGSIAGLTLSATLEDLARLYLATIQAVAHGTRHIIETMNARGYAINTLMVCGGGTKNPVFLREHADITGCTLVLPRESEAVLAGAAVLGAVAAGHHGTVMAAMSALNAAGEVIRPRRGRVAKYHDNKYKVFHRQHADFRAYRRLMNLN
ncbi:FGGY-family carbohydrate kinase [Synoicihabitans lomoniglobus]|uniref:FGGY-family carbohydrate kinase n=1 Tax=Synoicihabitans lomoniglobus TaxID=2909285 RepID=A0AAE9ZVU0_9BACT|nr:FGGY-family carbohydrate kinase [Opitutaceae bacterium LMO-M01]WED63398.1 FGGY-family carbohydrate kinase [Opitutaceae bacterium LMO-M01]